MQKYIQQVILDIKLAESKIPDKIKNRNFISTGGIEDALKEAEFEALEKRIGISKDVFPPIDRLNSNQVDLILVHLINVLEQYGYFINISESVPSRVLYTVLVGQLPNEVPILANHKWQLALCGYDTKRCPFGSGHCQCRDWESILLQFPGIEEEKENGLTFVKGFPDEHFTCVED